MGIVAFCNAVAERMTNVMTDILKANELPEFLIGADKLANEGAPPRVVFIPLREIWRGPHGQGGDGVQNPRPLATRHVSMAVHVWAADNSAEGNDHISVVESLLSHLMAAIQDVANGIAVASGGNWEISQDAVTRLGAVYVLDLEVQIPATRELDTYAAIHTITNTPVLEIPNPS